MRFVRIPEREEQKGDVIKVETDDRVQIQAANKQEGVKMKAFSATKELSLIHTWNWCH